MSDLTRRGLLLAAMAPARHEAVSPDGSVRISLHVRDGHAYYNVTYRGSVIVEDSRLGFDGPAVRLGRTRKLRRRSTWKPLYGERASIPDAFEELSAALGGYDVVLRAYNEGAALRYRIRHRVQAERTEFRFPPGSRAWEEHGTEGEYSLAPVESIKDHCEWPLTVALPGGRWACVTEAALDRYPRMLLSVRGGALAADLMGPVEVSGEQDTPWRVILLGRSPGELLERNYLVLNLNPPARGDFSWVKPGKAIREVTLSTPGGMACVDFAVQHGLQYIEYDAGWYGHEYDDTADARAVSLDPKRVGGIPNHPGLDLPAVIAYARQRGIGVLLYVNRRALERQLDEILPLYASWGVAGVKYGFVQVGPQPWTTWLMEAVRKAARHKLVVDIHDAYRPTGFSRTFPNLLTQEGVRGNEHMPTARHNCTLPFTRAIAGAADVTICYYNDRIKTTHAHQLAMAVVSYSPLQFLFWYDRPQQYQGEPEVEFFRFVPTVWDETRVLQGVIGEYAVIARRKDRTWFIGGITNEEPRAIEFVLAMLLPGQRYEAVIYRDDPAVQTRTHVGIARQTVDRTVRMSFHLPPSGGFAIRITPVR